MKPPPDPPRLPPRLPPVDRWYHVAEALHGNFNEDELPPRDIAEGLDDVELLPGPLEPLTHV